jgi:hypothetical protein
MGVKDLPIVGEITLPVRLMDKFDDKGQAEYHPGFALWKIADCLCDVGEEDNPLGTVGGTVGGHLQVVRNHENGERNNSANTISLIDVRDIWYAFEEFMNSEEVQKKIAEQVADFPRQQAEKQKASKEKEKQREKEIAKKLEEKEEAELLAELEELEAEEEAMNKRLEEEDVS